MVVRNLEIEENNGCVAFVYERRARCVHERGDGEIRRDRECVVKGARCVTGS